MQVGINAAANGCYFVVLMPALLGLIAAPLSTLTIPFAFLLALINFLCVFETLSNSFVLEAVLAWSAWLLPMNWLFQILGLTVFVICTVFAFFGMIFNPLGSWWPGTLVRHGFLWRFSGAFTLGNFTFVSPSVRRTIPSFVGGSVAIDTAFGIVAHENGHTLTTAAFGNFFGIILWVHDRLWALFFGAGGMSYGEMICEGVRRVSGSGAVPTSNPWIPMWAPPVKLLGPSGANAPPVAVFEIDGVVVTNGNTVDGTSGTPVVLSAGQSVDPDSFPMGNISPGVTPTLGFHWRLTVTPDNPTDVSATGILFPTHANTQFTPDVAGDYQVDGVVTDGAEAVIIRVHVSVL
jgi:hypothetical protein